MCPASRHAFPVKYLLLLTTTLVFAGLVNFAQYENSIRAQPVVNEELPINLQYIPADAAVVAYLDTTKVWNHSVFKSIHTADAKTVDALKNYVRNEFGLYYEDVQSLVAFVPTLKNPSDIEKFGLVITVQKGYKRETIEAGVRKLFSIKEGAKIISVNDRVILVLMNLGDEFAKPQPATRSGPLSARLKEIATGKHAAFIGSSLASLPDELRADDLPVVFRSYGPLFHSQTITATLDLNKTLDLDVRVTSTTPAQTVDCEKALSVLLALIQKTIGEAIDVIEKDSAKNMGLKDLLSVMKAAASSAKGAKYSVRGNEVQLTASLPTDLPYGSIFLAAKERFMGSAPNGRSANNLKQIALALHNYHDVYGRFPPAAVCDKKGNPILSWRVLILPFIESNELYQQFKLDEPWDSAHNKKLLAKMPRTYAMPETPNEKNHETYYRVFVGNGSGFDWVRGIAIVDIKDGTSNTLMCVTADKAVPWTKPDELEFDPEKDMTKLLGAHVNGKVQFAMFDGSVRTFSKIPSKEILNALITRDGGEIIPEIP